MKLFIILNIFSNSEELCIKKLPIVALRSKKTGKIDFLVKLF